jgi:hypothetical protein
MEYIENQIEAEKRFKVLSEYFKNQTAQESIETGAN